ncbi:MAG: ribosomal RNA small subunit methyltransferase A, partial [Proteobacteria bacterium]|nr:ribosomal RNA small subunit methyltransferase A [Pseudomonadota bacterium]
MSYSKEEWVPAKRSLGQNFLVDENICRRIVDAVAPGPGDTLVEIGPGRGALTGFLVEAGPERYLTLEKDHALAAALSRAHPGVEVIDGDALQFDWDSLAGGQLKIAGNLPYNVASRIIWEIVHRVVGFERAIFMVQHEVAL